MSNSTDLLDEVTKLLAYVGDEGAKDGYYLRSNNVGKSVYSVPIRPEPLETEELETLVAKVKELLENDTPLDDVPKDIVNKVNNLKKAFSKASDEAKAEVVEYLGAYEANPMQGGKRRVQKSMRKRRKNRKTRRNRK
jgi:cellulose biosynthesis protein BcsQ